MRIKFKKNTWVIEQYGGDFCGNCNHRATELFPESFEVISVEQSGKRISNIHVSSDRACDGENIFLINVPNELFDVMKTESDGIVEDYKRTNRIDI